MQCALYISQFNNGANMIILRIIIHISNMDSQLSTATRNMTDFAIHTHRKMLVKFDGEIVAVIYITCAV